MSSINHEISKAYGITLIDGGAQTPDGKKFTNRRTQFENWQEALEHARTISGIQPKALQPKKSIRRDADPILIYVTDRWGEKVRVNKNALEDPKRLIIPVYNRNGDKITDSKSYDPKKDLGRASIHKANIVGTKEHEEDQKAVAALEEKWKAEEKADPDPEEIKVSPLVDRPEYEPHPDLPLYRWSNQTQSYILGHKPPADDPHYLKVKGEGAAQYTFYAGTEVQLSLF